MIRKGQVRRVKREVKANSESLLEQTDSNTAEEQSVLFYSGGEKLKKKIRIGAGFLAVKMVRVTIKLHLNTSRIKKSTTNILHPKLTCGA